MATEERTSETPALLSRWHTPSTISTSLVPANVARTIHSLISAFTRASIMSGRNRRPKEGTF
jgi:hypothetical protein